MKPFSRLIQVSALVSSLVLVLPVSAILQVTEQYAMNSRIASPASVFAQTPGGSSQHAGHPAKPCPLLELRAGLALVSVRPASNVTIPATTVSSTVYTGHVLSACSAIQLRSEVPISGTNLSLLRILRI